MRLGVIQYDDPGYRESFQMFAKKKDQAMVFLEEMMNAKTLDGQHVDNVHAFLVGTPKFLERLRAILCMVCQGGPWVEESGTTRNMKG